MEHQHPLLEWFTSVDIKLHSSLYLEQDAATGLSFYTAHPLPADTTVIQVPHSICITSSTSFERIQQLCTISDGKPSNIQQASLPAADWTLLYLVLSRLAGEHLSSGQDDWLRDVSTHLPYVAHIPQVIETPLHFSSAELRLLESTPLVGSTERRLRETIVDYERARSVLFSALPDSPLHASFITHITTILSALPIDQDDMMAARFHEGLELWRWAESAFTSRTFPPRLINHPCPTPILIPGYDTFNHARARPVTWSNEGKMVDMTLNYPLEAGKQVWNNYGGKSNEEFLSGYGFVLDSDTEDTLALKLGAGKTHYWSIPAGNATESVESDSARFVRSPCPCPPLLDDLEGRILQGEAPPTGEVERLELYAEVLETLESLLLTKRKAFRASQARIDSMTPPQEDQMGETKRFGIDVRQNDGIRSSVWNNVMQYRKGQLRLLNHAVDWTRRELGRLADALDALDEDHTQEE